MKFSRSYYDIKEFIKSGKRICVNQGGTRSGKTYSTLQILIEAAIVGAESCMRGMTVTICRKTYPSLRATALRDFIEILESLSLYNPDDHNISTGEYFLGNCTFEFISLDQPQKVRGRKRDILFCNEANELTYEDWRQLLLRTTGYIFLDYNPSDEYHFIYDKILTRDDVVFYITTYKDNPFLNELQIKEIERLRDEDENYWKIYGLGLKGASGASIYTNYEFIDAFPLNYIDAAFGIDFGYNNATALMKCARLDAALAVEQRIYKTHLTNNDLIRVMREVITPAEMRIPIYCDSAEPDRIEELRRAGFRAFAANKNVKDGIDKIKSVKVLLTKDSHEAIKEIKNYKWKLDHNEKPTDIPVKIHDHAMDAMRYPAIELIGDRKIKARVGKLI